MTSAHSTELAEKAQANLAELRQLIEPVSAGRLEQRPSADEWSVKEVLAHLLGPPDENFLAGVQRAVDEDTPLLSVDIGAGYLTDARKAQTPAQLLSDVEAQYGSLLELAATLAAPQLDRKIRVPNFSQTPLTETPTLETWLGAIFELHLGDHIGQVRRALD